MSELDFPEAPPAPLPARSPPARRRIPLHWPVIAFVLLSLGGTRYWVWRQQEFVRLNQEGVEHLEAGRTAQAVDTFRRALRLQPKDATLRANLGVALEVNQEFREAIRVYQDLFAVTKDPRIEMYQWRATCASGDFQRPMTLLWDYRLRNPTDREAMQAEGECRLQAGEVEAAASLLEQAVTLGAGAQARASLERARQEVARRRPAVNGRGLAPDPP